MFISQTYKSINRKSKLFIQLNYQEEAQIYIYVLWGGKEVSEELGAFPSAPVPQIFIVTETSFPPPPPNLLLSKKKHCFLFKENIWFIYSCNIGSAGVEFLRNCFESMIQRQTVPAIKCQVSKSLSYLLCDIIALTGRLFH